MALSLLSKSILSLLSHIIVCLCLVLTELIFLVFIVKVDVDKSMEKSNIYCSM